MNEKYEGYVQLGMEIEIDILFRSGDKERIYFRIVPDEHSNYKMGLLSEKSSLAQAIIGEKPGTTVPYFTQETMAISIQSVTKSNKTIDPDVKNKRNKFIERALNKIQFRDALLFAASTETKWGSYDADGLNYLDWQKNRTDFELPKDEK